MTASQLNKLRKKALKDACKPGLPYLFDNGKLLSPRQQVKRKLKDKINFIKSQRKRI